MPRPSPSAHPETRNLFHELSTTCWEIETHCRLQVPRLRNLAPSPASETAAPCSNPPCSRCAGNSDGDEGVRRSAGAQCRRSWWVAAAAAAAAATALRRPAAACQRQRCGTMEPQPCPALRPSPERAGVRWAVAADADCVGQELAPNCSLLLMSTSAGQDCSPACAASVAALVQSGCWDAVVSMASSMGLGGNL